MLVVLLSSLLLVGVLVIFFSFFLCAGVLVSSDLACGSDVLCCGVVLLRSFALQVLLLVHGM